MTENIYEFKGTDDYIKFCEKAKMLFDKYAIDGRLTVRAHRLAVGVELRLRVAHESAVRDERVKRLLRLEIMIR